MAHLGCGSAALDGGSGSYRLRVLSAGLRKCDALAHELTRHPGFAGSPKGVRVEVAHPAATPLLIVGIRYLLLRPQGCHRVHFSGAVRRHIAGQQGDHD